MVEDLPEGRESVAANDAHASAYRICPTTPEDVRWIAEFEGNVYQPHDAIPFDVLAEWHANNPDGFNIIRKGDEKIGHVDILPLRPSPLRRILAGEIFEREVRGADLYSPDEKGAIRDLYVESVAVTPQPGSSAGVALSFILANFDFLVERLCAPAGVDNVYASAASKPGERLMRHLGFAMVGGASERVDKHGLWGARFSDLSNNLSALLRERGRRPAS